VRVVVQSNSKVRVVPIVMGEKALGSLTKQEAGEGAGSQNGSGLRKMIGAPEVCSGSYWFAGPWS